MAGVQVAEHPEDDNEQHEPYDELFEPVHDLSYRSINRIIISHKTPPLRWDIDEGGTTWGGTINTNEEVRRGGESM